MFRGWTVVLNNVFVSGMCLRGRLCVLIGLLALLALVFAKTRPAKARGLAAAKLASGQTVTLEKATFGKTHTYSLAPDWELRLRKALPPFLAGLAGAPPNSSVRTYPADRLLIWLGLPGADTQQGVSSPGWDHFELVDDHGCRFYVGSWGTDRFGGTEIVSLQAEAFPRRTETFHLEIHQSGGNPPVSFVVPYPGPKVHPAKWKAQPLPATRTNGAYALTLAGLAVHRDRKGDFYPAPAFEVLRNGLPDPEWGSRQVVYSDETGNQSHALCPFEPVWKMDVKFFRTVEARFDEGEIWRVRGIPVPGAGQARVVNQERTLNGVSVRLLALAGPGSHSFSNGVLTASAPLRPGWAGEGFTFTSEGNVTRSTLTRTQPFVVCSVRGLKGSQELLLRATDEKGRLFRCEYHGSSGEEYFFAANQATNCLALDLELIPQTALEAQYFVDPRGRILGHKAR